MRALDHLRVARLVGPFADGELDARGARLVSSHLEGCWECSGRLELLRLVRAALRHRRRREPTHVAVQRLLRASRSLDTRSKEAMPSPTGFREE